MRRVERSQAASTGGQDYLASVSDLMSGLIFIFIITVAVFALRLAQAQEKTEEIQRKLSDSDTVRRSIVEQIEHKLREANVNVIVQPEHGVIRLSDQTIGFESGRAEPRPEHQVNVQTVAHVLLQVLKCYVVDPGEESHTLDACPGEVGGARVDTVMVEGHTDSHPIAEGFRYRDNLELSSARSAEVLRRMAEYAPSLASLRNDSKKPVLSVSGYGETRPLDPDDTTAAFNRRIDIRFLMELPNQAQPEPQPVTQVREELAK